MPMLKFDFSQYPDPNERPYETADGTKPVANPITVSMVGKCVRANAYHHRGEPRAKHPNLDAFKSEVTFSIGTAAHETLQRGLIGLRDIERTVKLTIRNLVLEGRIDGLLEVPGPDGEPVLALLEAKTMNPYAFSKFKDSGDIDLSYQIQANTYAAMLRRAGEPVNHILWVMIERGNLEVITSLRPCDPDLGDRGISNALTAITKAPEDLPRLEPRDGKLNWQCSYCSFWRSCWDDVMVPSNGKVELYLEVQP
jgi:PD-(D/E)XK nuclease superfamily